MARKFFSPGTFIPMPQRVVAITQLCLVFTFILWVGGYPFMGELFSVKARKLIYEAVIDDPLFGDLPLWEQKRVRAEYRDLGKGATLTQKLGSSIKILGFELSPFTRLWVLVSIVVPLLCLLRIEGARQVAWLLPIIALLYAWENHTQGFDPVVTHEVRLFPSEEVLVNHYLGEELAEGVWDQKDQLERGWKNYLNGEWGGEFGFNLARIEAMKKDGLPNRLVLFRRREPALLYLLYFLWNLVFAGVMAKNLSIHSLKGAYQD